jgi:hypothetical protein
MLAYAVSGASFASAHRERWQGVSIFFVLSILTIVECEPRVGVFDTAEGAIFRSGLWYCTAPLIAAYFFLAPAFGLIAEGTTKHDLSRYRYELDVWFHSEPNPFRNGTAYTSPANYPIGSFLVYIVLLMGVGTALIAGATQMLRTARSRDPLARFRYGVDR